MAVELEDGTIVRSLPEQVSKNLEDIIDLANRLAALKQQVEIGLSAALHYKGSVATYGDLPSTGNEIGDLWNVLDTGNNYAWTGSAWDEIGSSVDLSNYAQKTGTANYFTNLNTFSNETTFSDSAIFAYDYTTYWKANTGSDGNLVIASQAGNRYVFNFNCIRPYYDNSNDLGDSLHSWRNGHFSGQVYAQNTFNVINASDIVSNTLTQAQYDLITNGKPTLIKGTFLGYDSIFVFPAYYTFGTKLKFQIRCNVGTRFHEMMLSIDTSTRVCASDDSTNHVVVHNIAGINGKTIPAYPADTGTFTLKCVDGVLTWVSD